MAAPAQRELEDGLAALCSGVAGLHVFVVPHLYHIPDECEAWQAVAALEGSVVVAAWLHPRPAQWLLRRHGAAPERLAALNLAAFETAEDGLAAVLNALALSSVPGGIGTPAELAAPVRLRWYPVVDQSRCANCGHCLQFCLFGVYAADEAGRVQVASPDRCKAGCPACSRICPEGAIMFPLYPRDEAIAGAPGMLMAPDLAARRMFYTRTRKPCPVCGSTTERPGALPEAEPGALCQECGRELQAPPRAPAPGDDALDALIDDLDRLARRRA